jgi:aminocarboxymuconate-semialdehyde decarboxylase
VFLHPQNAGDVRRLESYYLWNVIGFPFETTITATRLIVSGLFERHPTLNVVLAHGGGYFPYQLGRLDHGYRMRPAVFNGLPRPPSFYLRNVYCDSLTHNRQALRFLLDRIGADHVVLGSDYPLAMACDNPVDAVEMLGLAPEQQKRCSAARCCDCSSSEALARLPSGYYAWVRDSVPTSKRSRVKASVRC